MPPGYSGLRWHESSAVALAALCQEHLSGNSDQHLNFWLPAYFCGQSLRYLRGIGVQLCFYPLDDNLLPDYPSMRQMAENAPPFMLLHVHYFGRIASQKQSREFADKTGALLIEDCAHVISPRTCSDWVGDYLIFSPHKLFALPSVGLTFSRKPFAVVQTAPAQLPWSWFLRHMLGRGWRRAPVTQWKLRYSDDTSALPKITPNLAVRRAAVAWLVDFEPAALARWENALWLLSVLGGLPGWHVLPLPGNSSAPFILGMMCETTVLAQSRFVLFNRHVRLAMQWPDLPKELQDCEVMHDRVNNLAARTLFFFVHQCLPCQKWRRAIRQAILDEDYT